MNNITKEEETKYLEAVSKHITSLGYEVEEVNQDHLDLLDVWGYLDGRKCFVEIYVTIHRLEMGIVGYWTQGDNDSEEVFYNTSNDRLDTRFFPLQILEDLKPIRKKA